MYLSYKLGHWLSKVGMKTESKLKQLVPAFSSYIPVSKNDQEPITLSFPFDRIIWYFSLTGPIMKMMTEST